MMYVAYPCAMRKNMMNTIKNEAVDYSFLIKEYRKMNNLNQSEFAKLVGCTQRCVSEWETGKRYPQKSKQDKLMEIFEPILEDLYRRLPEVSTVNTDLTSQSSKDLLISLLDEYSRIEPDKYRLMLQIHDMDKENVYLLIELVSRLNSRTVER